jgi:hypothetical protein
MQKSHHGMSASKIPNKFLQKKWMRNVLLTFLFLVVFIIFMCVDVCRSIVSSVRPIVVVVRQVGVVVMSALLHGECVIMLSIFVSSHENIHLSSIEIGQMGLTGYFCVDACNLFRLYHSLAADSTLMSTR